MIIIHSFVIAPFLTAQLAEAERLRNEDVESCKVCVCVCVECVLLYVCTRYICVVLWYVNTYPHDHCSRFPVFCL